MAPKKLYVGLLIVIFVLTSLALVCVKPTPASGKEIVELKLLSSKFGSRAYLLAVAVSEILKEKHPWLRAFVVSTTGTLENIKTPYENPELRKYALGQTMNFNIIWAMQGNHPFDRKYPDLQAVFTVGHVGGVILSLNPKIKTPKDLVGKKVGVWPVGHSMNVMCMLNLKAWGVWDKITPKAMGPTAMSNALRDGLLDAVFMSATEAPDKWVASPAWQKILLVKKGYFVSPDEAIRKEIEKTTGVQFALVSVKAKEFGRNQPQPVKMLAGSTIWLCYKDVPEKWIYELVKTMAENVKMMGNFHKSGKSVTPERLAGWLHTPRELVHPGALKYYDEKGLKVK